MKKPAIIKNKLSKEQISELKGATKILDMFWEGSYYRCGKENSKMIEENMIHLFGENWVNDMYKLLRVKGAMRPAGIKPLFKTKK